MWEYAQKDMVANVELWYTNFGKHEKRTSAKRFFGTHCAVGYTNDLSELLFELAM